MTSNTGEIGEYVKILDGLRKQIIASQEVVVKIRDEVNSGDRKADTELERTEIQLLKELRGALIIHLHSLNKLLGND